MPFTLTHVAAVLPFRHRATAWLPLSALVIGSMVPDIPMFIDRSSSHSSTHNWSGLIPRCLPIGVVAYLIFQTLIRTPLFETLPKIAANKLGPRCQHSLTYLGLVVLAILLGASTHIVWDAFTHAWQWGTKAVPVLTQTFTLFGVRIKGYAILQHGSSVVFLPLLGYLLIRFCTTETATTQRRSPYHQELNLHWRTKLLLLSLMFAAPALWAIVEAWINTRSVYYGIGKAARAYGTYVIATTLVVSLMLQITLWYRRLARFY